MPSMNIFLVCVLTCYLRKVIVWGAEMRLTEFEHPS